MVTKGEWTNFEVLRKQEVCRDTVRLTFGVPAGDMRSALAGLGSHLDCAAEIDGEVVVRPYTPYIYPTVGKDGTSQLLSAMFEQFLYHLQACFVTTHSN